FAAAPGSALLAMHFRRIKLWRHWEPCRERCVPRCMPRYRFDFLRSEGALFAAHEIDYPDDQSAIRAALSINEPSPIGDCFEVWRDGHLLYCHRNEPAISD